MIEIFDMILDITKDVFENVAYFVKKNLVNFANVLNFVLPIGMYFIGRCSSNIWEGILVPIVCAVIIFYLRSIANKMGKGITIPVPNERFTEVDDEGEVTVESKRVSELLLYTADLEDWLERKGLL